MGAVAQPLPPLPSTSPEFIAEVMNMLPAVEWDWLVDDGQVVTVAGRAHDGHAVLQFLTDASADGEARGNVETPELLTNSRTLPAEYARAVNLDPRRKVSAHWRVVDYFGDAVKNHKGEAVPDDDPDQDQG